MKPALLTPVQLEIRAFVDAHPGATTADLVAVGWGRTTAATALHELWRAGVLVRGYARPRGRREPSPPYGYCVSARPVDHERVYPYLHERAASLLQERGPLTSRELADALGTTPKTIATIARKRGWAAVSEPVRGGTPRLRWSA